MNRSPIRKQSMYQLLPARRSKRWWLFKAKQSEIKKLYRYWDRSGHSRDNTSLRIKSYWKAKTQNQSKSKSRNGQSRGLSTTSTKITKKDPRPHSHDEQQLPSTRNIFALSPFEHYQAESSLNEFGLWEASNKTTLELMKRKKKVEKN
jgi:hypothetical protein